jgi:hypothetical protein
VRCPGCASRASGEARKVWTPDAVVAAIQAWARLHGEPPCMTTWSITRARNIDKPELTQVKLVPYKAGEWPLAPSRHSRVRLVERRHRGRWLHSAPCSTPSRRRRHDIRAQNSTFQLDRKDALMRCAGCRRELDVGDQYIQFGANEYFERNNMTPLEGMDDIFAELMGSNHGDKLVYCEDCTEKTDDGWKLDTVYGDEGNG